VDDLEDVWEIDKFQEHESNKPINLMLSQIHLCQKILFTNLEVFCPKTVEHDDLRKIIEGLGVPKPFPEDMMVSLQVVPSKTKVESQQQIFAVQDTLSTFLETKQNTMLIDGKELMVAVLLMLPDQSVVNVPGWALVEFLEQEQARAVKEQDPFIAEKISDVIIAFKTLRGIGMLCAPTETRSTRASSNRDSSSEATSTTTITSTATAPPATLSPSPKSPNKLPAPLRLAPVVIPPEATREFVTKLVNEFRALNEKLRHLTKRLDLIQGAHSSLEKHQEYLTGRQEVLRIYLENVKKGGTTEQKQKSVKVEKAVKAKLVKMTADQLLKEGLISKIEPEIDKKFYKAINFKFSQVSSSIYQVEVSFKGGFEMNVLDKPIQLYLEDLLRMSEERENSLYFDPVTLNTNILIHFLNHHFGVKK